MNEVTETWKAVRRLNSALGENRRNDAEHDFAGAAALAGWHGMRLVRRNVAHYQLSRPGEWLLDIYPGNQRLFSPKPGGSHPKRSPYLDMKTGWTLAEVVRKAVEAGK